MKSDELALGFFVFSLVAAVFALGVAAQRFHFFPVPQLEEAMGAARSVLSMSGDRLPWYYVRTTQTENAMTHQPEFVAPGLTLVSTVSSDNDLVVKVVDQEGRDIHEWNADWFEIWPDPDHLPEPVRPQSRFFSPGTRIAGMVLMESGDLVFNFEKLGMVRVTPCGDVVWRLAYQTHHSMHLDGSGNLWVSGVVTHEAPVERFPNFEPPFEETTVLEVSPDGEILNEISIFELLQDNGLLGLLYMDSVQELGGDTLHLNDVETFPTTLAEGVFKHDDVMLSLREINTVMIFDPETGEIRYSNTGTVLRQHDPDFVDGNSITVFDNNNVTPIGSHPYSRIVKLSAVDDSVEVLFSGTQAQPFYSHLMGKHEWLPNGNILLTESSRGRAIEVDSEGRVVWEYFNLVEENILGIMDEAQRLAPSFDREFFAEVSQNCPAN
jgi:hypothetical protein